MTADTTHYPELAGIVAGVTIAGHLVCRRLRRRPPSPEQGAVVAVIRDSYRDECAEQGCPICAVDGPEDAA